jgi:threonine dehydrogenase-like Zn-dependent dehydrogenase
MQQLTFVGPRRLVWRDVPQPTLSTAAAALVRPVAVATCDLDAGIVTGAAPLPGPFAFGHEFVADVTAIGDAVQTTAVGQRVVVPFQINCGTCDPCTRGLTASCARVPLMASYGLAPLSREYGGALSDLVQVPFADAMLVPLPDGVDPAAAASASDNIPDGWRAVAPFLADRPAAPVLVLGGAGGGSVGLYAAAVAVALGSERVDYVDEDPDRLAVAERLGANAMQEPIGKRYGPYPITVNTRSSPRGWPPRCDRPSPAARARRPRSTSAATSPSRCWRCTRAA